MPVEKFSVEGFDAFKAKVKELEEKAKADKKTLVVLFSGSKDDQGKSWCPDCDKAFPVINKVLDDRKEDILFLYVGVGGRDFWKDQNCIFRKDPLTKLKSVPTLVKWGDAQRLEEGQCAKEDMVKMLFEEDDS